MPTVNSTNSLKVILGAPGDIVDVGGGKTSNTQEPRNRLTSIAVIVPLRESSRVLGKRGEIKYQEIYC